MFVDKWEPGLVPEKPELKSAPVWIELRNVPFQFFIVEGLEHIASLVGKPIQLHQSTELKTNLTVAKVLTLIDPRQPLPEAVNAKFESGSICRIDVSSPWMPPICDYCRDIGHTKKRCSKAPALCSGCGSTIHTFDNCPRAVKGQSRKMTKSAKSREVIADYEGKRVEGKVTSSSNPVSEGPEETRKELSVTQEIPVRKEDYKGKGPAVMATRKSAKPISKKNLPLATTSANEAIQSDTSHGSSSDHEKEYSSEEESRGFKQVLTRRRHKQIRGDRGVSLKIA